MKATFNGKPVEANGGKWLGTIAALFAVVLLAVGIGLFLSGDSAAHGPKVDVLVKSCSEHTRTDYQNGRTTTDTDWRCRGTWVLDGKLTTGDINGADNDLAGETVTANISGGTAYLHAAGMRLTGLILGSVGAVLAVLAVFGFVKGRGRPFIIKPLTQEPNNPVIGKDLGGWDQT